MRKVVAGNWKMQMGPSQTRDFFRDFNPVYGERGAPTVLLFPPSPSLAAAAGCRSRDAAILLGVQNIYHEDEGAFTGEVSVPMARDAGATHALVGHSERRHLFGETDADVRRKVDAVSRHGLVPVICVGETLEERSAGRLVEVIDRQLVSALAGLQSDSAFMVAYEPVWAIGTGETATPSDATEAHGALRERLAKDLGPDRAAEVPVLYGGSVKPGNAADLMAAPEVDGVLVGGASLAPESFARISEAGGAVGAD